MKFIDVLHRGRAKREPNPAKQDLKARCALYTVHPARNVLAAPIKPPIKDDKRV